MAIRIRTSSCFTVHALETSAKTLCGRKTAGMEIIDRLELESLPAFEGCRNCLRVRNGWSKPAVLDGISKITAEPAPGRLRTTGPLRHGLGRRSGRRLR